MVTALSIAAIVLLYAAFLAVFVAGSIGLVRAAGRTAQRRPWPTWCRVSLVPVAVLAAVSGAGLVYALIWPFRQLRNTHTPGARRLLYAAAALSVLLPSGCMAGSVVAGRCFFDPPPGDQLLLTIVDDTPAPVTVVNCLDVLCDTAQTPTAVAAGGRASMPLEGCAGGTMGVLDAGTDRLRSCIPEPTEDGNGKLRSVAVSDGRSCGPARTGVRVVDPGA